jgi:Tfp pilus assembly protein PilF
MREYSLSSYLGCRGLPVFGRLAAIALALTAASAFELYSNSDEESTRRVARGLEGFRAVFGRLAPDLDLASAAPTVVLAFRDGRGYAPYRHGGGPGGRVIGQFSSHPGGNAILLDASGELLDALAVIYHESVHELVRLNFPSAPLWFHEGLAEYYSTLRIGDETIEVGAPVERHLAWLRKDADYQLGSLVRLPADASALAETDHVGRVYAVSWALVHHLLSGDGEGSKRLADFLIALHEGSAPEAAFDFAFPQGLRALEDEIRDRVETGSFATSKVPVGGLGGLAAGRLSAAAPPDVLARLGMLLVRQGEAPEAERHFDLALAYDEWHTPALVGLGHLRSQSGQLEEAGAWFESALEAGGFDAEEFLLYGKYLLKAAERSRSEGRSSETEPSEFEASVEEARRAFRAAQEAFPGYVEARALLGASYLYEGDPRAGIDELVWARQRAPARPELAYWLALLYIRAAEYERAEWLIAERLDPVEQGEMYRQASEELERTRLLKEAERAFADGDSEFALALLEQAIDRTTDADLRRQLEARYQRLSAAHDGP